MNRLVVGIHTCLLEGFAQRRMCVACSGQILGAGSVLNRNDSLGNHLSGVGPDDMCAEDSIRLGIGQDLDKAIGRAIRSSSAVGGERKRSSRVLYTSLLEFFLGFANGSDLGICVNNAWKASVGKWLADL
jgi:hypothetical protein